MRPYVFPVIMPTLYLVPTPLGDPDDITLRALRILREVGAIATDDAQSTQKRCDSHHITTQILPYSDVFAALDQGDVALVSKTGTPGIGDAAHELVVEAIARGIRVEPLPGANAAITALVLSGLPTDAFVYVGALPDDLSRYAHERDTMIFTTHDVTEALIEMMAAFGDRRICIAARLTQPNEGIYRGLLRDALEYDRTQHVPDEIMIVVEGAPEIVAEVWDEARVRDALRARLADGEPLKLAAKAVAALAGWDRRTVYALGVDEKRK
ncbi:MAG: 16S rRNA (cytidine(1402)-2'-O)-methyltransferase [Chloroflexi bacterium]|nr:16S rRNA (cytidine(1402)-2'-O)-methyltransferase [Chloroflexota bacterium]